MERIYERDSYVRTATGRVLSCREVEGGWEVVLDRTLFYPGGGGQPEDRGTVGGVPVLGFRKLESGEIAHLLPQRVEGAVELVLDWPRRYDHMQQHTGQHLITVTASAEFGLRTIAFHISDDLCDIEFDAPRVGRDMLDRIEMRVNERVAEARAVRITTADREALERGEVRSRLLPDHLDGPLRIVEIDGLDRNTCGGTHVANLSELRLVKLLHTEKLSRGTRVYYVAGGRILRQLSTLLARQDELTAALQCGPEQHTTVLGNLMARAKEVEKTAKQLLLELGRAAAESLVREPGPLAFLHRPDGDAEFLRAVASVVHEKRPDLVAILVAGEAGSTGWGGHASAGSSDSLRAGSLPGRPPGSGNAGPGGSPTVQHAALPKPGTRQVGSFAVVGPEEKVAVVGPRVMELLAGRGGGRGTLFQGKAGNLERLEEVRGIAIRGS